MVASTAPEFDVRRTGSSRFMIWKTSFWSSGVYLQSKLSTSQRPNCAERSEEHFIERRGERVSKTNGWVSFSTARSAERSGRGRGGGGTAVCSFRALHREYARLPKGSLAHLWETLEPVQQVVNDIAVDCHPTLLVEHLVEHNDAVADDVDVRVLEHLVEHVEKILAIGASD